MQTTPNRPTERTAKKGQSIIIIALAMFVLLAIIGLAVDGGSTYAQRRNAQNAADAAALAAAADMLPMYNQMILDNQYDVAGTHDQDVALRQTIDRYAQKHSIDPSNLQAYYVTDNKQVVGGLQVGQYGNIPWPDGAKGILVKNRSETNSFFINLLGWNTVGATATSTAFMGLAVDSEQDLPVLPVAFFTETQYINSLQIGQEYNLISSDITYTIGSGNWGWIDFNNSGSANIVGTWEACGYNARTTTSTWADWVDSQNCGSQYRGDSQAAGPTQHFMCADHPDCTAPVDTPIWVPYLKWGIGDQGWWLAGQTGTRNSNCQDMQRIVGEVEGQTFKIPIFDQWIDGSASTARFHLAMIGNFRITDATVNCHPNQGDAHWSVNGIFQSYFIPGGTGRHGDLRHTSSWTVFLDN